MWDNTPCVTIARSSPCWCPHSHALCYTTHCQTRRGQIPPNKTWTAKNNNCVLHRRIFTQKLGQSTSQKSETRLNYMRQDNVPWETTPATRTDLATSGNEGRQQSGLLAVSRTPHRVGEVRDKESHKHWSSAREPRVWKLRSAENNQ